MENDNWQPIGDLIPGILSSVSIEHDANFGSIYSRLHREMRIPEDYFRSHRCGYQSILGDHRFQPEPVAPSVPRNTRKKAIQSLYAAGELEGISERDAILSAMCARLVRIWGDNKADWPNKRDRPDV
jgi:hypothetical protein